MTLAEMPAWPEFARWVGKVPGPQVFLNSRKGATLIGVSTGGRQAARESEPKTSECVQAVPRRCQS